MKISHFLFALLCMANVSAQTTLTPAPVAATTPDASVSVPPWPKPPYPDIENIHNVEVGKGGDRVLHAEVVLPKNRPAQPMPAVIWIHGGGWKGGSQMGVSSAFLAPYGYVAISIEYRLTPEAKWPAQIEDCKLAVRYFRANAAKYDIDPNRIGIWGHSAGGHLACLLGTTADHPDFEGTGGFPGVSSSVQAVVDQAGPNDFVAFPTWAAEALFGKDKAKDVDTLTKASPIYYVKAGDPPFLIIQGDVDKSIPLPQSLAFKAALEKAGVPVTMVIVKGGDHGLSAPTPGGPPPVPSKDGVHAIMLDFFEKNLKGAKAGTSQ